MKTRTKSRIISWICFGIAGLAIIYLILCSIGIVSSYEIVAIIITLLTSQFGFYSQLRQDIRDIRGEIGDIRGEIGDIRGEIGSIQKDTATIQATLANHEARLLRLENIRISND